MTNGKANTLGQQVKKSGLWRALRRSPALRKLVASLRGPAPASVHAPLATGPALGANEAFLAARAAARPIDGMFSDFSMAVIDSLLSFQKEAGISGNILEMGVYKGRSAALIGTHLAPQERLILVDIMDYLDRQAIAPFRKSVDFILTPTDDLKNALPDYAGRHRSFRFIHIDASHNYAETFTELAMADELLADRGIISMDDFTNLNYSQNIAAIFKYLYTQPTDLALFLVTDEKGYLCRKQDLAFYVQFVLDRLISEMGSRDISDCVLARTDVHPDYRAVYARTRLSGETGHHYGVDIESYRNNFLKP